MGETESIGDNTMSNGQRIIDGLKDAVAMAKARFNAMTPEQQAAHREEQRKSFVRGQLGLIEADRAYFRSRGIETD